MVAYTHVYKERLLELEKELFEVDKVVLILQHVNSSRY